MTSEDLTNILIAIIAAAGPVLGVMLRYWLRRRRNGDNDDTG